MASGDTLLTLFPQDNTPPATLYATFDTMAGTSTPAEAIPVLDFDDTAVEYADFYCVMPRNYAGGGVTLTFVWSAAATANAAVLSAAFRRVQDDAEDLDTTAQTYDYNNTGALTPPNIVGEVAYDTLTFTDGADMDSVAAGEYFILRLRRVPTDGSDTLVGDLSLHVTEVKET
jgi:hypothetical protein